MQLTTFVSIVLAIISSTTFSFYCGIRTVRLVGQRTLNFVKPAGQTSPCSSSSPFALNQICIERSESGPQDKLRQSARNNPSKVTHLRRAMRMYAIPTSYDNSWDEERATNGSAALSDVANLCVQPWQWKTVQYNQPENWFDNLSVDHVTKLVVEGVHHMEGALNDTVELLVLPTHDHSALHLAWPEHKQDIALGRHILITKGKPMITVPAGGEGNSLTSENVIDVLLDGRNVALLGQEGIGKSTELNVILLQLFKNLVDPNNPLKDGFQRANQILYHYHSIDGKIVCSVVPGGGVDLKALQAHFQNYKDPELVLGEAVPRNDVVLVLEMAEQERDPTFTHIPTVVAVTDEELLKTFHKAGTLCFAARPPHTEAELMVLATVLFHSTDRAKLCENLGLSEDFSLLDVRGQVEKRIQKVGPFVRKVLGSRSIYSY